MKKDNSTFDFIMQVIVVSIGFGIYTTYQYFTAPCPTLYKCISVFREQYKIKPIETTYKTKIAIIDTGFDPVLISEYQTFFNHKGQDTAHGTNVTGIVLGVNSNVELILIAGGNNNIVNSIKVALEQNPDIINISLNSKGSNLEEAKLIKENPNVLFVTAMGNDGYKHGLVNHYPAAYEYDNMLRVASLDYNNNFLESSNLGTDLDGIGFLGKNVCSFGYCMTGTSQATPFITGFASIIKGRNKDISIKDLKNELKKITVNPKNRYFGYMDIGLFNKAYSN